MFHIIKKATHGDPEANFQSNYQNTLCFYFCHRYCNISAGACADPQKWLRRDVAETTRERQPALSGSSSALHALGLLLRFQS